MNPATPSTIPIGGLSALGRVALNERHGRILDFARATCGGVAAWRVRKLAEVHELAALAQISNRLKIEWLDVTVDLRAVVEMRVTVPCLHRPDGPLEVMPRAVLGFMYRQAGMVLPQPGYSFVQILAPSHVWCANVSRDVHQVLCLGPSMPAGVPLKEIILMAYGALTMQTVQLDAADAAGVLNAEAADWWLRNAEKFPLSREPFLGTSEART